MGVSYKKRLMVTKSVRIPEDLLKRVEAQLWNEALESVPHGRQAEFYTIAVQKEVERLEGKNIDVAIDDLSSIYAEIGKSGRCDSIDLSSIATTIYILKEYKAFKLLEEYNTIKGEEIEAIK